MRIHFICSGNIFRSKLAELYLKSKNITKLKVTSSGINGRKHQGKIKWCTHRLIQNYQLDQFFKKAGRQISQSDIDKADLLVFMNDKYFKQGKQDFNLNNKKTIVLNIEDIPDKYLNGNHSIINDMKIIKLSEKIFIQIKKEVDKILEDLNYV